MTKKKIVIIGAGFSGVETAVELQDMIKRTLKYYPNIDISEIRILIMQRNTRILLQLSEKLSNYVHKKLVKRGVEIHLETSVLRANKDNIELKNGDKIYTKTVVTTIGGIRDFITHFSLIIKSSVLRWYENGEEVLNKQDNLCIKTDYGVYRRYFTALEDCIIMTIPNKNLCF